MSASCTISFWPDTGIVDITQGELCNILPFEDAGAPGGWNCECMENECDGYCALERVDIYDETTGILHESTFTCVCGG